MATGYAHTVVVLTLKRQGLPAKQKLRALPVLKEYEVVRRCPLWTGPCSALNSYSQSRTSCTTGGAISPSLSFELIEHANK